ncbi:hypothetical protein B0H13DRAFT_1878836 [Mycena leptocephala]|nr:hypothetical protein B0H13DRAFT_1878836 [Mycena leptocephala]
MAQSAPSRHWDTAPPPAMHSDTTQADNRNNIYTGLVLGRRNDTRLVGSLRERQQLGDGWDIEAWMLKFLKHSTTVRVHKDYGGLTQRYNFGTRCAALYKAIAKIMTNLQCVVMPAKVSAILPKSCDRHNINQDFPEFPDGQASSTMAGPAALRTETNILEPIYWMHPPAAPSIGALTWSIYPVTLTLHSEPELVLRGIQRQRRMCAMAGDLSRIRKRGVRIGLGSSARELVRATGRGDESVPVDILAEGRDPVGASDNGQRRSGAVLFPETPKSKPDLSFPAWVLRFGKGMSLRKRLKSARLLGPRI